MSVAEIAVNAVTNTLSFGSCLFAAAHLWKVRNHHAVKPLQPLMLVTYLISLNLASTVYTWGNVSVWTWEEWVLPQITFLAAGFAILFVMILRYYQAFMQTENKIRIASKLLDENHNNALKLQSLEKASWIESTLEKSSGIAIFGFLAFIEFSLPFYLFIALGRRDVWTAPASYLESEFLGIVVGVAVSSVTLYNIALTTLMVLMRKKNKDIVERIKTLANTLGISILLSSVPVVICYASPLARISFQTFQFMPILNQHISMGYEGLFIYFKVKGLVKIHTHPSVRGSTNSAIDSPRSSEAARPDSGIKNEFISILDTSEGFKIIMEAAKKEFCVENVLFYAAVSDWEALPAGSEEKLNRAREIVNVFCVDSAAAAVNISYKTRMELATSLSAKDIGDKYFEAAKKEIVNLMLWQTYVKVRKSVAIQELLSQA